MRNAIAPYFAVVVLSTVIFLVAVPQETQCEDPLDIANGAVSLLTPFVNNYQSSLGAHTGAENVKIRVWMHNGDPKMNGCGFYITISGYSGGSGSDYFPNVEEHKCGNDRYKMRMTSQSAMYDREIHLGKEQTKTIEIHADGWTNTFVKLMCFGFGERTIAGGPRAFCINNDILKSCKYMTNKWNNVNIDWDDMMMTRTRRGAHKMIFRDIDNLISGFERLGRNCSDKHAFHMICNRIDLEAGGDNQDSHDCASGYFIRAGNFSSLKTERGNRNKDPYGCDRNTNN